METKKVDLRKGNGGRPGMGAKKKNIADKKTLVRVWLTNKVIADISGSNVSTLDNANNLKIATGIVSENIISLLLKKD